MKKLLDSYKRQTLIVFRIQSFLIVDKRNGGNSRSRHATSKVPGTHTVTVLIWNINVVNRTSRRVGVNKVEDIMSWEAVASDGMTRCQFNSSWRALYTRLNGPVIDGNCELPL